MRFFYSKCFLHAKEQFSEFIRNTWDAVSFKFIIKTT